MNKGYVKIYRQILDWEWYKDIPVRVLFEHCVLKANIKDKNWKGVVIKKGSFITSMDNLGLETGLTKMQIRTALKKLKATHEITHETTSQYSIITVKNWDKFQPDNTQDNTQITHEQHTDNTRITLTKECRELKNKEEEDVVVEELKKNVELKNYYGEYSNVHLDDEQLGKLKSLILNDDFLFFLIDELSSNIAVGRAPQYNENQPWGHFAMVKKYWNYRKTHPNKFKSEKLCAEQGKTTAQIVAESKERMKKYDDI